ncbi:MAG TPA: type II toxin-antitoxin system VapC family toxin [Nitrososphaerales archaeon]|nr:type II toxin-antitoxin system VapC family toxin [Nitrososphaerales archaeon]
MIYLDANVFIYSSLNRKALGDKSRSIIKDIQNGKMLAATSALSFDELVWAVKKHRSDPEGVIAGEVFLNIPGLTILDVKQDMLNFALKLIKKYHINPRDSIHAASALDAKAEYIVSEDRDFDLLTEIKRKPILQVLTSSSDGSESLPSRKG